MTIMLFAWWIQRLASTRRAVGGSSRRSWFAIEESGALATDAGRQRAVGCDADTEGWCHLPIELRHLDSEEDVLIKDANVLTTSSGNERSRSSPPSLAGGPKQSDVPDDRLAFPAILIFKLA